MQKILLIATLFILTGCGSDTATTETNQTKFKIGNTTLSTEVPKHWTNIPLKNADEVFIAESGNTNFIILRKNGYTENIKNTILNDLKENLFSFSLQAQSEHQWQFLGKLSARTPQRDFYQKIIPIAGTSQYLWGSCSSDYIESIRSDCPSILDNWVIVN